MGSNPTGPATILEINRDTRCSSCFFHFVEHLERWRLLMEKQGLGKLSCEGKVRKSGKPWRCLFFWLQSIDKAVPMYISSSFCVSNPAMHLRIVVFPQHQDPKNTTNSLFYTSRPTLSVATTLPKRFVNCLIRTLAKNNLVTLGLRISKAFLQWFEKYLSNI